MDLPKQSSEGLFCWCWVRGASAHQRIEARREVILDLPEVCYPWKVLAAIQAIQACSPFSSLTGDTGSKNSCQKGFSVIDKPPTEAPPLASPNKTARNLRVGGKTCWAACGIKQQEESETVTVTVDFYKRLCNPRRKSPEGLEVVVLIPSPAHAPPSLFQQPLQLLSRLQLSPASVPPVVPVLASGKIFCSILSDSCTLSTHVELLQKGEQLLPHCPFPTDRALNTDAVRFGSKFQFLQRVSFPFLAWWESQLSPVLDSRNLACFCTSVLYILSGTWLPWSSYGFMLSCLRGRKGLKWHIDK